MISVNCIILAGGKSSRMKFNKEYIEIDGEFLVHKNIKKLQNFFKDIVVITNNFNHYKNFNVRLFRDVFYRKGPMAGLHSGLFNSTSDFSFLIACDMPNIDINFIKFLISKLNFKYDGIVCLDENNKIMPMYAIYKNSLKNNLKEELIKDNRKFIKFIENNNFYYISYNDYKNLISKNIFENLNTIEDIYCFNKQLTK